MTTLLFVHSPVVGPTTWTGTAEVLQSKDFRCAVADLTGAAPSGPPYYPKFAATAAKAVTDGPVVLIGHSAAGPLLPAIAEAVGSDTVGAVFVDSFLPHPGRSWFDMAPVPLREQLVDLADAGRLPPWNEWFPANALEELVPDPNVLREFIAEIPRLPLAFFLEPGAGDARLGHAAVCLCALQRGLRPHGRGGRKPRLVGDPQGLGPPADARRS